MYFEEFFGAASMSPLFVMHCVVICCFCVPPGSEYGLCGDLLFVYISRFWRCSSEDGEDRPSWMTELGFTATIFNAKSCHVNHLLSRPPSKLADENSHWYDLVTETLWIVCSVSVPANHDHCEWMYPIVRSVQESSQGSWELVVEASKRTARGVSGDQWEVLPFPRLHSKGAKQSVGPPRWWDFWELKT